MRHFSEISVYTCVSKGWGPNSGYVLEGLGAYASQEVNRITLGRKWIGGAGGLTDRARGCGVGGLHRRDLMFNCFPRSISFHRILGTVSFSPEDKLVIGKYVNTVSYQDRTFYIVVYKLRASNKNGWLQQED